MLWNETKECMSRDEMHALQSARLVKMVERVYYNVPFYRKKMQEMGLELGDVKGIEDITKLPFTTKSDLRDNYPFGLLAVPRSEIVRVHASSGTTGKATVVAYTRKDLDLWSECVARAFTMAGVTREDTIQIAYGYGLFTGGLGAHAGAERLGATVVPMSTGNTKKLTTMMKDFDVTAMYWDPVWHATVNITEDCMCRKTTLFRKLLTRIRCSPCRQERRENWYLPPLPKRDFLF